MAETLPWSNCKVAYPVKDPEPVWRHFDRPCGGGLPLGWRLVETGWGGSHYVAVFEMDVLLTIDDGAVVAAIIAKIEEPAR